MENQLNFEVVSNEDLMTINGGQNMSMNDGISTWFRVVQNGWKKMIKNHWMKKLKYLSLFFLLFAIYWFPDVILAYPEVYLKSLVGYERQVVATWIFLGNMSISLFLGILICYKLGYYKNTISIFTDYNNYFICYIFFQLYLLQFSFYNTWNC